MIPWNSNAIFCSQTLGVSPFDFIPYCFKLITPIISFTYGALGFSMKKYTDEELREIIELEVADNI
ncbi:hypothetical protein Q5M85_05785 [Paraclostridium bifermentans]|nr:hypothetical protein [Paraclostridium bifermentans]